MQPYLRRVVDDELDELLPGVAAIALKGARGIGKTETATARAATVYRLDNPQVRAVARADPERLVRGDPPILIDEWQLLPMSWDLVRRAVDADRTPGRFLLTGSASPRNPPAHSGAGRIVSLHMRPMTLAERGIAVPSVSLAELLTGRKGPVGGTTGVGLDDYAQEILASGFPGLRELPDRSIRAELDGYIDHIIDRDFEESGQPVRNPAVLRRWMQAYAAAISSITSYEKIRDAATAGRAEKPAKTTVLRYADVLESIWVIDPISAWRPTSSDLTRLTLAPKHQLVDPALAARLRRATMDSLLEGSPVGTLNPRHSTLFGALFEAQVSLDVRVYAQASEAAVFHFRDKGGAHEIDLIVEGPDQRVVAVEVKLAQTVTDDDVRHLLWLRDKLGDRMLDAVVVTTGREAYRRQDGIAIVPAALLGV